MAQLDMAIDYLTRGQWQARPPKSVRNVAPSAFSAVEFHHSATPIQAPGAAARSYQRYHMDINGWKDIFYNWLIHPNGVIVEGRGWGTSPRPENFMTVCFIGNYDTQTLSHEAKEAARALVGECVARMPQLEGRDVRWHSQRAGTSCPGTDLVVFVRAQNKSGWKTEDVLTPQELDELVEEVDSLVGDVFSVQYKADRLRNKARILDAQAALVDTEAAALLATARRLRNKLKQEEG